MYKYNLTLWLSDDSLRKSKNLKEDKYKVAIEVDAPRYYNSVSKRSKNPKTITECVVDNSSGVSEIRITLESSVILNTPNRALKVYSSYLANGPLSSLVRHKSLFRGSSEKLAPEVDEELSNEALLNILIRCVIRNSKSDKELLIAVKETIKEQFKGWR